MHAVCLIQIGELAGKLSDEAREISKDIPWKQIRGLRNVCAHNYGNLSLESVWVTISEDLPALRTACINLLG